jgi:4-hydroxy-4-methyl-2-oxoglutarate aldolase
VPEPVLATATLADDVVAALGRLPVATVYEAGGKLGDVAPSIRPVVQGLRLAGRAFTVKTMPSDNLAVFRAIDEAPPGSILLIDAGETVRSTIWGGSSTIACVAKGIAGCVTNGAARDIAEVWESRFPLFTAGISLRGTVKTHPGWLQIPIAIGGAVVRPGDVVLGDDDGVLVVPAERASEIADLALERRRQDEDKDRRLRAGEPIRKVLNL